MLTPREGPLPPELKAERVRTDPLRMHALRRLRESSLLARFGVLGLVLTLGVGLVLAQVLSTAIERRAQEQAEWTVIGTVRLGLCSA